MTRKDSDRSVVEWGLRKIEEYFEADDKDGAYRCYSYAWDKCASVAGKDRLHDAYYAAKARHEAEAV